MLGFRCHKFGFGFLFFELGDHLTGVLSICDRYIEIAQCVRQVHVDVMMLSSCIVKPRVSIIPVTRPEDYRL